MRRQFIFIAAALLAGCGGNKPGSVDQTGNLDQKETAAPVAPAPAVQAVRIPSGTVLKVRLDQTLDTSRNDAGDSFAASLASPVALGGKVLLPKGTPFRGHINSAKASGRLKGRGYLSLTLDSFALNRKTYQIDTSSTTRVTASHKKRNIALIGGGSGAGAIIGAIAGGGKGALIGAGAGAAAGTAGAAATGKKNLRLPAETLLAFTLKEAVSIEQARAPIAESDF